MCVALQSSASDLLLDWGRKEKSTFHRSRPCGWNKVPSSMQCLVTISALGSLGGGFFKNIFLHLMIWVHGNSVCLLLWDSSSELV